MNKKNTARIFATFMLILIALGAIALIILGFSVFQYIFIENQFWFDLSNFSLVARNGIIGLTGLVGAFLPIAFGISLLIRIIGEDTIMRWLDKLMN